MSSRGLLAAAILVSCGLTGCGGGGEQTSAPSSIQQTYAIGGSITGLSAQGLVLQDNGGDNLTVPAGTTNFTFATPIATGGTYAVTVMSSPANTTCSIAQGSGTVAAANITNIRVTCTANSETPPTTYTIGGSISGLTGSGLVLQDNGGDNLTVPSGATSFTFATSIATGRTYAVTVMSSPANMTCSIAQGSGTVAAANITNIRVTCTANSGTPPTTYSIGGSISGLTGSGLVLSLNSGNSLLIVAASAQVFTFTRMFVAGTNFSVTVQSQPTNETCTVMNGTGTVGAANVTNVVVSCSGRFVYVANATDGTTGDVSQFSIDAATGALSAIASGIVTAGTNPSGIAVNFAVPNTPEVYVANATSADITAFAFFTTSAGGSTAGALFGPIDTLIVDPNNPPVPNLAAPIAVTRSGAFLFAAASGTASPRDAIYGFTLDQAGNLSIAADSTTVTGGAVSGLTIDPTSTLLFATTSATNHLDVYSIASGANLTAIANSPFATGVDPQRIAVWPKSTSTAGFVYTANRGDNTITAFSYSSSQGSLKLQPATTYSTGKAPLGITIDPTGTYLYTANSGDGTVSTFSINQTTGALAALGAAVASGNLNPMLHANPGPVDLVIDPSGKYLYCVNGIDGSISLFKVSVGVLTLNNTYATGAGAAAVALY
jgi:6-phosphogluconolactonase (cycloisomerase 2 family)